MNLEIVFSAKDLPLPGCSAYCVVGELIKGVKYRFTQHAMQGIKRRRRQSPDAACVEIVGIFVINFAGKVWRYFRLRGMKFVTHYLRRREKQSVKIFSDE